MKLKFFATPNLYIRVSNKALHRITGLKGFHFDENGEYVTENEHVAKALKAQFKFEEVLEVLEVLEEVAEKELIEISEEKPKRSVRK